MKRGKLIAAFLSFTLLTIHLAADNVAESGYVSAETDMEADSEQENSSKYAGAAILLGTVFGATIISALLYRSRNNEKYL